MVLNVGPAKLFMTVIGPVISIGTYVSNFILDSITRTAGFSMPDTCAAIHAYTAQNVMPDLMIDANQVADLVCLPTRLSGFFSTAIGIGFKWMVHGIGHAIVSFISGAIFVVIFAWNAWKFALMALSIIMNLFLGVVLLPMTALAESIPQTSYKGIAGNIFNSFTGLFNVGSLKLENQINKFVNSTIYFISLSIVISVCAALLSGIIDSNMDAPTLEDEAGFLSALLAGALAAWMAGKADSIARNIGGSIPDSGTGDQVVKDVTGTAKGAYTSAKSWVKSIYDYKKSAIKP